MEKPRLWHRFGLDRRLLQCIIFREESSTACIVPAKKLSRSSSGYDSFRRVYYMRCPVAVSMTAELLPLASIVGLSKIGLIAAPTRLTGLTGKLPSLVGLAGRLFASDVGGWANSSWRSSSILFV